MSKQWMKRVVLGAMLLSVLPMNAADKKKDKKTPPPRWNTAAPVVLTAEGEKWAQKTLKTLTLEQKVGQLIMVRVLSEFENVQSPSWTEATDALHKYHVGSVIITVRVDGGFLQKSPPYEAVMMTNRLQREAELPLLVAADFERGASMRLTSTAPFPHAMAFGAAGKKSTAT